MSFFQDILTKVFKPADSAIKTDSNADPVTELNELIKANINISNDAIEGNKIDIMAILENLANKYPQKLNWKVSIVDLLTLLGLDNSLTARKKLAAELGYQGDTSDTATMNVWLIKEVIKKLDQAGGDVNSLAKQLSK